MRFLSDLFGRPLAAPAQAGPRGVTATPAAPVDRATDPWFWSHYEDAARIVLSLVPPECLGAGKQVVDFGCGDGATTLGVASRIQAHVTGVDLYKTFLHLPESSEKNLGTRDLPRNLSFAQNEIGRTLPCSERFADLVYSWSVFEHVADPPGVLSELARIVKPGGTLFIQIEPLYYSPFGSHLQRLIDEPWAHLSYSEEEYLRKAEAAPDNVPTSEKDTLYRTHRFDEVKRHLIAEYKSLNKLRAEELLRLVTEAGFEILMTKLIKADRMVPDESLLQKFPLELLLTNQIVLVARRAG